MAKPLAAARMVHAYSPAKPSPLSRILMLANSPESPDIERPQLGALEEEMEGDAPGPFVSVKTKSLLTSSSRQLTIPSRIPGAGDTCKGGRRYRLLEVKSQSRTIEA